MSALTRQTKTPQGIVWMVIGTMCVVLLMSMACTVVLAWRGVEPVLVVFSLIKDVILLTLGHVSGVLNNTRTQEIPSNEKVDTTETSRTVTDTRTEPRDETGKEPAGK